jgi:hypothetical protein
MDKATIIGLILSWASLVVSVILEELHKGKTIGDIHVAAYFLAGPAVLVFGGSFGATLIGLSGREIKELPAKLKVAFFRKTHDVEALIKQLLDFAVRARRDGILALENDIDGLGDPFMKKGFQLAIDGADEVDPSFQLIKGGGACHVQEKLVARRAAWVAPPPRFERGYGWMFSRHILQADDGCDFDYLETSFGAPVGEPDIF